MAAVRRVPFVCSLCLAWCSVALATEGAANDRAIEQVKEKAREAFDQSDRAMACKYAASVNVTNLLSSLDGFLATVRISEGEEEAEYDAFPLTVKEAIKSLQTTLDEALKVAWHVTMVDRVAFKANEIKSITNKFRDKMLLESSDARDAIELQRMAERTAELWEGGTPLFELQLSATQDADNKAKAAAKAGSDAVKALLDVEEENTKYVKRKVRKANGTLDFLNKKVSPMTEAAEEVKKMAEEAPKLFREAAEVFIAPNDVQEGKGGKKPLEGNIAENTTGKPTADTGENTQKNPTTDEATAPDTRTDGTMTNDTTKTEKRTHNTTTHNTTKTEKRAAETKTDNTNAAEAKAEETTTNRHSQGSSLPHASVLAISGVAVTSVFFLLARVVAGMVSV